MKIHGWFAAALVGACLSASSVSAQDPAQEDALPLTLKLLGGAAASDGAIAYVAGSTVHALIEEGPGAQFLVGALFVAPAASVSDFQLLDQGLVLLDVFDATGSIRGAFPTSPAMAGLMISGRAYAYDGVRIVESPVRTIRFL
jgi:hypothetical protein